jgi:excinuclease ABC subunit A
LSPAISIEQRSAGKNPRSTVGTVTEIYDYLRLLFARIVFPIAQIAANGRTSDRSANRRPVLSLPENSKSR